MLCVQCATVDATVGAPLSLYIV